jgi:hypothetical protein
MKTNYVFKIKDMHVQNIIVSTIYFILIYYFLIFYFMTTDNIIET